jgi:hypothetical protein
LITTKAKQEEEAKKRLREWEKMIEQKTLEFDEERNKWENKLKKIASERDSDIQSFSLRLMFYIYIYFLLFYFYYLADRVLY